MFISATVIEDYAVCSTITVMVLRRVSSISKYTFENRIASHVEEKVLYFHYCLLQKAYQIVSKAL